MLLTIAQPTRSEFGFRYTHDFPPRNTLSHSRLSPLPKPPARVDSPVSSLRVSEQPAPPPPSSASRSSSAEHKMSSGPHPRGLASLPPPSSMTLPDPRPSQHSSLTRYPPAPAPSEANLQASYSAGHASASQEEAYSRALLEFKAEEERRKQEEEKTRQESLRLEQRKIEAAILHDALHGGIPPQMVPIIYAGIGSARTGADREWVQQLIAQFQALAAQQPQQQLQALPQYASEQDHRREGMHPSYVAAPYVVAHPQSHPTVLPSQSMEQPPPSQQHAPHHPPPLQTTFAAYNPGPRHHPQSAVPRSATHTQLPRLTTNDIFPAPPQQGSGSAHPLHQSQTADAPTSSPIFFHHWQPPAESKSSHPTANQPQTPATNRDEPHSAHPSHLSEQSHRDSPRKRKAQGGHQPQPPPSAGPSNHSPDFAAATLATSAPSSSRKGVPAPSPSRESDGRPDSRRGARDRTGSISGPRGRSRSREVRRSPPAPASRARDRFALQPHGREETRERERSRADPQRPRSS